MNNEIENIKLKFACDADWNNMTNTGGAKHCNACQKKVYDFTNSKQQEFLQILAENNNNVCGRFRADQMTPTPIRIPVWKTWVSAAMVLIGVNIFNSKVEAQTGKPRLAKHQIKFPPPVVVGDVEIIRYDQPGQFPGGDTAMNKFLIKNIHFNKGMISGKVIVNFTINKDGTLSNYKILRGLNKANNDEVIRVLKLSPKWEPATLKGKTVVSNNYTIPVNFQKP